MEPLDSKELEEVEMARIRRNRRMSVEEILAQHDEALRSVLECMRAAEAAKLHRTGEGPRE